jgi:hypothetical protein
MPVEDQEPAGHGSSADSETTAEHQQPVDGPAEESLADTQAILHEEGKASPDLSERLADQFQTKSDGRRE